MAGDGQIKLRASTALWRTVEGGRGDAKLRRPGATTEEGERRRTVEEARTAESATVCSRLSVAVVPNHALIVSMWGPRECGLRGDPILPD